MRISRRTMLAAAAGLAAALGIAASISPPVRDRVRVFWRERALPRGARPPVLVVTLDGARADAFGFMGATNVPTPAADALAAGGFTFRRAYAPAVLCRPSHVTVLTGLLPRRSGVREDTGPGVAEEVVTLAERFREAGYRTGAFLSSTVVDRASGLSQGFETFDDDLGSPGKRPRELESASAVDTVYRALAWFSTAASTPTLMWVHLDTRSSTGPGSAESGPPGQPHLAGMAVMDRELGRLVDGVRGMRKDAIAVVLSDHGEALGDHGEPRHGYFVYGATTHVPLVISGVGVAGGTMSDTIAGTVDVTPTLLDLAGLPPIDGIDGRSLVPMMVGDRRDPPRAAVIENMATATRYGMSPLFALRRGPYLYVHAPRPELYDVQQDPRETDDASARLPTVVTELQLELRKAAPDAVAAGADPKDGLAIHGRYLAAVAAQVAGRVEEAVAAYRAILSEAPGFSSARRNLSEALVGAGRFAEAEPVLSEVLARGEANDATHLNLGLIRYRRGDREGALAALQAGLAAMPWSAALRHRAGRFLIELGRPEAAVVELTEAARLDGRYDDSHLALGEAWEASGRVDEATAAYRRLVALMPETANGQRAAKALERLAPRP